MENAKWLMLRLSFFLVAENSSDCAHMESELRSPQPTCVQGCGRQTRAD